MSFLTFVKLIANSLKNTFSGIFKINKCKAMLTKSVDYNPLTPTDNAKLSEYENALLYALHQEDIKNIAITGPYGSGKSSILRTFERKFNGKNGYQFLNISLATFDTGNQTLDEEKRIKLNNEVEKSLLQQIFFKVTADELEDSHFSRLSIKKYIPVFNELFLTSNVGTAFFLATFVTSLVYVLKPNLQVFQHSSFFLTEYTPFFRVFAFISGVALLQQVFNSFPKMGLNKLGAAGAEISFNERRGESILNKFIDELIYFFVKTKYNIVVFEDLDRFPSRDIFIKLREINTLLNYSDEVRKKRKLIKFIFVLGDDVFQKSDERTKFFDFIIPVIPIINSFNAEEKLRIAVSNAFKNHSVKNGFFGDIGLFIDDMRMLLNIANEFVIYKRMLDASCQNDAESSSKVTLDDTKLLSMIVYKNKYPEDFKELNFRKGLVANVFSNKTRLQHDYMLKLENEIGELHAKLSEIENEKTESLEALKRDYLGGYFQRINNLNQINVNGEFRSYSNLISDDNFESLISQNTFQCISNGSRERVNIEFKEIEDLINPDISFNQRKQNILDKTSSRSGELKKRITDLGGQLEQINSLKLKDFIQQSSDENLLEALAKQGSNTSKIQYPNDLDLIRFLIVNGYIEEDYDSYMSYFYPGELSTNDKQFLISLANHKPLGFEYKLDNAEKVCQRIQPDRFNIKAVLNFDLLDHLLIREVNPSELQSVCNLIVRTGYEGYGFVNKYMLKAEGNESSIIRAENRILINKIASYKKQYWRDLFESLDNDQVLKCKFLGLFLRDISIKDLLETNEDAFFRDCVAVSNAIYELFEGISPDKISEVIKTLNVKFSDLTSCDNQDILQLIVELEAFRLNDVNIIKILKTLCNKAGAEINAGYTYILDSGQTQLINYVNHNLESYARDVLMFVKNSAESESSIITLINSNIDIDLIEEIIKKLDFKISKIETILNNESWSSLFDHNRIDPTWDNVIKYFEYKKEIVDVSLITFLNTADNSLKLASSRMTPKDLYVQSLSRKIIYSDALDNEVYSNLIKSVPYWFGDLSDAAISNEKIKHLLRANKFQVTKDNHDFLKSNISNFSYQLIEKNYSEYAKDPSVIDLEIREYKSLIDSVSLKDVEKLTIVKSIPEDFYDTDVELAKKVCTFVVQNTKEKVFSLELTEKLLSLQIDFDIKVKLFNRYAADFDSSKIKSIISNIDVISGLANNKRPKVVNNMDTFQMVMFLCLKGYLSYKEDKNQLKLTPKSKILN